MDTSTDLTSAIMVFFLVTVGLACVATTMHPCMAQRYVGTPAPRPPKKEPRPLPPLEVCKHVVIQMPDGEYMLGD